MVYGLVGVVLLLVALAASAVPALRAAGADPNAALRAD
jgi:ABC-type lipoprotein release transport system permease subunit